jgi:hypothetical protein
VGITHSESVSYSTDFENGASQANGFENVNLEGCNSTVTLVLSIKANDILSLLPGGYTTTITMDAQAEVV